MQMETFLLSVMLMTTKGMKSLLQEAENLSLSGLCMDDIIWAYSELLGSLQKFGKPVANV